MLPIEIVLLQTLQHSQRLQIINLTATALATEMATPFLVNTDFFYYNYYREVGISINNELL